MPAKPWYQSLTIWGAIVASLATIANACGLPITGAEQQQLAELLTHIGEGVGLVMVVVGRVRASHQITRPGAGGQGS